MEIVLFGVSAPLLVLFSSKMICPGIPLSLASMSFKVCPLPTPQQRFGHSDMWETPWNLLKCMFLSLTLENSAFLDQHSGWFWYSRFTACTLRNINSARLHSFMYSVTNTGISSTAELFTKNLFYWSIVDLQCCANFYYKAKWFSYTHTHTHRFFYKIFNNLIVFGCAGSSLLHGLFSSCSKWGLLSSCSQPASRCSGFSCCRARALKCAGVVVVDPRL